VVDQVQIGDAQPVELLGEPAVFLLHVGEGRHVVEHAVGAEADAHPLRPDGLGHGPDGVEQEPRPAFQRAAPAVLAAVDQGIEELFQEIPVGRVELHAVEAGVQGVGGGLHVLGDDLGQIGLGHGPGHREGLHAAGVREHLALGRLRHGTQERGSLGQVGGMADAAGVHELGEDMPVAPVDGLGHVLPGLDLGGAEQAGDAGIAQPVRGRGGALGDDEARRRALAVIGGGEGGGDVADGPVPGHGGHDDAVAEVEGSQKGGLEQVPVQGGSFRTSCGCRRRGAW
jgi:hypothetical protein